MLFIEFYGFQPLSYSGLPIKWTSLDPLGFVQAYRAKYPTYSDAALIEEVMNKVRSSIDLYLIQTQIKFLTRTLVSFYCQKYN